MLCQICENGVRTAAGRLNKKLQSRKDPLANSWDSVEVKVKLHRNIDDLHNSIMSGCLFCRHLLALCLQRRPEIKGDDGRINVQLLKDEISENGKSPLVTLSLEVRSNCMYAEVEDNNAPFACRTKYLMSRAEFEDLKDHDQSSPSGSPTSTKSSNALWLKWYTTCKTDHPGCQPSKLDASFRPTRLIQVHEQDSGTWNLVDETKGITEPYATLSHCWGDSQPTQLSATNIAQYKQKNPITNLPKTFEDAIEVCKSLGIYYIWIDSLCIIQQDQQDWNEQAVLMRKVYTHADCNIAASWARGSNEGCFISSDAALKHPTLVDLGFETNGCSVYQFSPMWSMNNSPPAHFIDYDLTRAPLNCRAWVVQERYMAPRQLSFTASQVYWECSKLVANEQCPTGLADEYWEAPYSLWQRKLLPTSKADFQRFWSHMVELYSLCGLTKKTDKLIALAGLAEYIEMTQSNTGNTYHHGLWRLDLHRQLFWEPDPMSQQRPKQMDKSIAPTWSWLSLDGSVSQDWAFNRGRNHPFVSCIQVLEGAHTSEPRDGLLSLRGIAVLGTLEIPKFRPNMPQKDVKYIVHLSDPLKTRSGGSLNLILASINWGVSQQPPEGHQPEKLCFFLVRFDLLHERVEGIVLQQIPGSQNRDEYVRLCTFAHGGANIGQESTHRSDLVEHIAVLQGWPISTEEWPTRIDRDTLFKILTQRAKRNTWEMDLDQDGMQDLVRTVHIR